MSEQVGTGQGQGRGRAGQEQRDRREGGRERGVTYLDFVLSWLVLTLADAEDVRR